MTLVIGFSLVRWSFITSNKLGIIVLVIAVFVDFYKGIPKKSVVDFANSSLKRFATNFR